MNVIKKFLLDFVLDLTCWLYDRFDAGMTVCNRINAWGCKKILEDSEPDDEFLEEESESGECLEQDIPAPEPLMLGEDHRDDAPCHCYVCERDREYARLGLTRL